MGNPVYKNPLQQAQADFDAGKISLGQLDDVALKYPKVTETKEQALSTIKGIADKLSQFDADDIRSYINDGQDAYIKQAVKKHGITKEELRGLHPHFFHPGNYGEYGLDKAPEPQPEDKHAATKAKLKEFGYSDEDIGKFKDEDFAIAADFFGRFNNPKPRT